MSFIYLKNDPKNKIFKEKMAQSLVDDYGNVYDSLIYVSRRKIDKLIEENNNLNKLIEENNNLKRGNLELKRENEELKNHIQASPDGELYFSARDHYKISLQEFQ